MTARLRRAIGSRGLFSMAFGSIIGVGWVTVLGHWLEAAGPLGSVLAFVLGGAVMLAVALCYAELTAAMPVAGGEIAFSYRAFGTAKAYWVGWLLAFGYISVSAFEAASVGRVLAYLWPDLPGPLLYTAFGGEVRLGHVAAGLGGAALLTWLNLRGARLSAGVQTALTFTLIAAAAVFVGAGAWGGEVEHLRPFFAGGGDLRWAAAGVLAVFVTVPLWFVGFDVIPQMAEEASAEVTPERLGRLILAAVAWATLFYAGVILAASAVTPWEGLRHVSLPTAAAFRHAFASPLLAELVLIAAIAGLATSWNGFFVAGTRVLFALGRARLAPAALGSVHPRHGTPRSAVWLVGGVTGLSCLLGESALGAFVNVSSICLASAFLGVALSAGRLRRAAPDLPRPYRMPAGRWIATLAAAGSLVICGALLAPFSPARLRWPIEWMLFGGWCALGALGWRLAAAARRSVSEEERGRLILGG